MNCTEVSIYNGIEGNNDEDDSVTALGRPEIENNEVGSGWPSSSWCQYHYEDADNTFK